MSVDHSDVATTIAVQRWRRWGHDRAYVSCGGRDLGHRDLLTGAIHCDRPDDAMLIEHATDDLLARAAAARIEAAVSEAQKRPAPQPCTPKIELLPDRDLAVNRPGSAARTQAKQLRDAAPVRTFFSRVVGVKTDERAWRIGADGEEEIARRLARLDDRWRVLHAVPVGNRNCDIDHVVIGPAGVFTVNTKHHPDANVWVGGDTVKINGCNQPYVRNSRYEAQRAGRLLTAAAGVDVRAHGIVAIVGALRGFTVRTAPADVTILRQRDVLSHLRRLPTVLPDDDIKRIFVVARHLATWQTATVAWQDF